MLMLNCSCAYRKESFLVRPLFFSLEISENRTMGTSWVGLLTLIQS